MSDAGPESGPPTEIDEGDGGSITVSRFGDTVIVTVRNAGAEEATEIMLDQAVARVVANSMLQVIEDQSFDSMSAFLGDGHE